MDDLTDALLAQLLGMGFEQQDVLACQLALKSSNTPVTVQSATDWLLQRQQSQAAFHAGHTHSETPTLKLGQGGGGASIKPRPSTNPGPTDSQQPEITGDFSRPVSSGSSFTSSANAPVKSRLDFGEEKKRKRDEYDAKEREEAIRKAREHRMRDQKAKELVRQQIAEDRQRKAERSKPPSKGSTMLSNVEGGASVSKPTPTQCRVQVRLLDGAVVRNSFEPSSTLTDVCQYITTVKPSLVAGSLLLVQPFPHKEFSVEEHSKTLHELGLCPSASLVVSKDSINEPKPNPTTTEPVPMDTSDPPNESSSSSSSDDDQDDDGNAQPLPPMGRGLPPFPGRPAPGGGVFPHPGIGLPRPPMNMPRPPMNMPQPGMPFPGAQSPLVSFAGEGHKLGGKGDTTTGIFMDANERSRRVSENAKAAAERRSKMLSVSDDDKGSISGLSDVPSLEVLSLRCLARWSSVNFLPSCSILPPRVAQRLIASLIEVKQLHPKTLNAFMKCPLQLIVLDNYSYATNQLIEMLRYFPSLVHLSLVSCTLLTDKSMSLLLPHLNKLVHLNLNGCHQLSNDIFQLFKCNESIERIKLAHLKLTDEGVQLLVRKPLQSLKELDLSFTNITSRALKLLSKGTPCLNILNIEGTKVTDLSPLLSLKQLHSLNVSQCPLEGSSIGCLAECSSLSTLALAHIPLDCNEFMKLKSLALTSLTLPDRNYFLDEHMECVSGFPLTGLDLTGYCNVTDVGIKHIARIVSLTQLSLSRTKLTDEGMIHIKGLTILKKLSLDNTLVTDEGMESIRDMVDLEELSVSDTKVSSQFLINGCLNKMRKLVRLNLVRTFIDNKGLKTLQIPSLMMLSIDFTCATEAITIETLRAAGCRSLELFRNRNIRQPTQAELLQQRNNPPQPAQQPLMRPGGHAHIQPYNDGSDDDNDY